MFKDYYSILGVTFPANKEEIRQAHLSKVDSLGKESSMCSSPNYQQRVDIEEAYRVLGASYSLKNAYDEEYSRYLDAEDKESFCIEDDWTQSQICSEHNFVVNHLLQPLPTSGEGTKSSWGSKTLGCLGKIFGFFLLILFISGVKTCSRNQARKTLSESYDNSEYVTSPSYSSNTSSSQVTSSSSDAERKLQKTAREINQDLPRKIDDNITQSAITLTSTALIYEYIIDDDYFDMYKDQALSASDQLNNIRAMYSDMKPMIDLLLKTHRGISYKYICKESGKTNIVEIPYSELAGI